ncbi:MAG: DUF2779 domain-containing protein [Actinobacteria bacterium]|nr:DUF2779 domain-containing protein [Actinomycetota bacterium]
MPREHRLSKSRFQAGLQCHKRLWLASNARELADPVTEFQQAIFDQGHRVGELARERFPRGTLVAEDHTQTEEALSRTADLLAAGASPIHEAALKYDGVLVRVDVLTRNGEGTWDLIEVKSGASVKQTHITDAAIQTYVLRGAGLEVGRVFVMHLDTSYVYEGGDYDLQALFRQTEVTEQVEEYLPEIPSLLAEMKEILDGECPDVPIGKHCGSPYECAFVGHCHAFLPDFPVTQIPRIASEVLDALLAEGIRSMRDVPPVFPGLTATQHKACDVVRRGTPHFEPALLEELAELRYPLHFLDFETFAPALPLHPGTTSYQTLPVQWSCHTMLADGSLEHREFLHVHATDPRPPFAESLLSALTGEGSVVVYSSFENTVLGNLATALPHLAEPITSVQARLFDLLPVIGRNVEHPEFRGRLSLKMVLPALVADLSYEDQAVADGGTAMLRYEAAITGGLSEAEREETFRALRAYCAVDTLGLVRVYQALLAGCDGRGVLLP